MVIRPRYWWLAASVVLLGVVLAWRWTRVASADAIVVQPAALVRTVQFTARVSALTRVDVGSTVTGRVQSVRVREGERVTAGQLLIQLETAELRAALAQARANEQQAELRLLGLRSTGRTQVAASLAQAEATLAVASAELERARQLVAQGFVSASRADDARRAVEVAQAQASSARAQVQANADSGNDMVQAEAQWRSARAATEAASARLDQTAIRAAAPGRVLSRDVEPGQVVQPGRALMALALDGPTLLKAQADERFLEELQPGQMAWVVADAFPGQRFSAQVQSIAPAVDAQRGAVEVRLGLQQEAPDFLRQDMTLSVEVETARRERALVLPLAGLRGQGVSDHGEVWVLVNDRVRSRPVRLGLRTLEAVEVLEGLSGGDQVLLGAAPPPGERARARPVASVAAARVVAGTGAAAATLTNAMGR